MLKTFKTQGDTIWTNHQVNQGGTRKCDTTKYCPNYINTPYHHKIGKKLKERYQLRDVKERDNTLPKERKVPKKPSPL